MSIFNANDFPPIIVGRKYEFYAEMQQAEMPGDARMRNYTGQTVTVTAGPLPRDDDEGSDLFRVRAADGREFEAFEEELSGWNRALGQYFWPDGTYGPDRDTTYLSNEKNPQGNVSNYIEPPHQVQYVIRSLGESDVDLDGDVGAFWSNEDGWGSLQSATLFSTKERMSLNLPMSAKLDAEWMLAEEARDLDANRNPQGNVLNYTGLTQDVLNALASKHRMTPGAISVSSDGTKSVVLERDDVDDRYCQAILTVNSDGAVTCHTGLYRERAIVNNGSVTEPSVEVAISNASAVFDDLIVRHAEVRKEENSPAPGM